MVDNAITNLHKRIAHHYTCYRITSLIDEDIKLIKKLNLCFNKLDKNDNVIIEILNIIKTLNNVLCLREMQEIFIEIIDLKYQQCILFIINNIEEFNVVNIRKVFDNVSFE